MNKPPQPLTGPPPSALPHPPAPSPGLPQPGFPPQQPSVVFATPPPMNPAQQPPRPWWCQSPASAPRPIPAPHGTHPAHVYQPGSHSQVMMIPQQPIPFANSQAPAYFIPGQYRAPYVTPQQYQVTGSPGFYPGTSPGDYAGPYYPAQPQFTPPVQPAAPVLISPAPQQQAPPQQQQQAQPKRERKQIRIRDPNQGGRDITEEIMSGGRSALTPTPPQSAMSVPEGGAGPHANGENASPAAMAPKTDSKGKALPPQAMPLSQEVPIPPGEDLLSDAPPTPPPTSPISDTVDAPPPPALLLKKKPPEPPSAPPPGVTKAALAVASVSQPLESPIAQPEELQLYNGLAPGGAVHVSPIAEPDTQREAPLPSADAPPHTPSAKETPAPTPKDAPLLRAKDTPAAVAVETPASVVKDTPACVIKETSPPLVKETPAPIVMEVSVPFVKETPSAVAKERSEPVVKETPAAVTKETPATVVKETPAAVVKETPAAVVKETPAAVVKETPAAVAKETPAAVVKGTPATLAKETPETVAKETPAAVVKESCEPVATAPVADAKMAATPVVMERASKADPGACPALAPGPISEPVAQATVAEANPRPIVKDTPQTVATKSQSDVTAKATPVTTGLPEERDDAPPPQAPAPESTMQAAISVPKKKRKMKDLNKKEAVGDLLDAFKETVPTPPEPEKTTPIVPPPKEEATPTVTPAEELDETWEEKEDKLDAANSQPQRPPLATPPENSQPPRSSPATLPEDSQPQIPSLATPPEDSQPLNSSPATPPENNQSKRSSPATPTEQIYQYKEEEWKPVDLEAKKSYDREFLLGFQFSSACMHKPEGLPHISDVVLDKANKTPLYVCVSQSASRGRTGGSGGSDAQTEELFRRVRSVLNKLTPQMFQPLMKQVTEMVIDTEPRLKGVIDLVFEKAISEPNFSVAYANMCRCLMGLKVPMADKPNVTVNFRKLLLNRCQKEFEKDQDDDEIFERKQKELEAATELKDTGGPIIPDCVVKLLKRHIEEAWVPRRLLSTISRASNFHKAKPRMDQYFHQMEKIIKERKTSSRIRFMLQDVLDLKDTHHACDLGGQLLKHHDEESLECLCRLLSTIGKDLDFHKAKPRMDQYFHQMEKIIKERKTSSRIRFMLQDSGWVPRRGDQGPKTIEQIHKDAELEEAGSRSVTSQARSWNTVPISTKNRSIDPTRLTKITKPGALDLNTTLLAPGGKGMWGSWGKGSSGGTGTKPSDAAQDSARTSTLNRFSALQQPSSSAPEPDRRAPQRNSSSREAGGQLSRDGSEAGRLAD
ncbi:hypothetical protein AALO_G00206560 [Alosa alosa]|uniref:MIF4G domain-containing protein n=1 Tax=Alosa alosa TaxID=278164 RepID=A0AAV6G3Z4_9TELE|nr:hypothetical protein AALO_G00206560 [Alosa alosa]